MKVRETSDIRATAETGLTLRTPESTLIPQEPEKLNDDILQENPEEEREWLMSPQQALDLSLFDAASTGDLENVKKWLEEGADPNATFTTRRIPILFAAIEEGVPDVVAILLENGADAKKREKSRNTALHHLVEATFNPLKPISRCKESIQAEIEKTLIAYKTDPTALNAKGETHLDLRKRLKIKEQSIALSAR